MAALVKPRLEPGLCIGKIDVADADLLKTEFFAPAQDFTLERRQVIGWLFR